MKRMKKIATIAPTVLTPPLEARRAEVGEGEWAKKREKGEGRVQEGTDG
jgi:hypothetical protein